MPWLNGTHDGRKILLPVAVLGSDQPSDLTHVRITALLDTGATSSGVGPEIIRTLQLLPYEKRTLVVATEDRLVDYYLFRIGLFDQSERVDSQSTPYVFAETDGFAIRPSRDFDVILGMDVLGQCDLRVDRSGSWELRFGR